jgi:hypothetical protein
VAYVAEALAICTPGTGGLRDKEPIYRHRIKAIKIALADRLQSGDYERAKLAKIGLLQQIRSLAGAYRQSGFVWRSIATTYINLLRTRLKPMRKIADAKEIRES